MIYMFLSNNPSSGDLNSSNLPCSNNAPGVKNGTATGSHILHMLILGKHEKIFLPDTKRPRALIFGM